MEQLALKFEKHAKQPADPETMDADPGAPDPELRPDPPPPPGPKPPPPQRRPGRNKLPEHLPHRHIDLKVPDADRACPQCGKQRGCIGHETSEQLDFVPSSLVVNVYSREKLACDNLDCNGNVVIAAKAGKVIDGGLAGAGMLAHVLVSKYEDHLPLYRQAEICQRSGIDVSDTTLCSWVAQMCAERLLGRLASCIWQQALRCSLIGADDKPWLARQAVRNIVAFVPLAVATVVWPRLGLAGIWGAQVCWMVMRAWANGHRWRTLVRHGFSVPTRVTA